MNPVLVKEIIKQVSFQRDSVRTLFSTSTASYVNLERDSVQCLSLWHVKDDGTVE